MAKVAFGFPAYHETVIDKVPPGVDIGMSLMQTLSSFGWGPSFDANGITASTGAQTKAMGEKIIVTLSVGSPTKLRSECAIPTKCMDGGKNQKNIERILAELPNHYVS